MQINGRLPLAGISNNAPAGIKDWKIQWTQADSTTVITALAQIVPLSGTLAHSADQKTIKDNRGNEVTVIHTNEKLTIELVCVPLGVDNNNTLSDVLLAARLPGPGGWLEIADAPALICGTFNPAFNSVDWMYNSDGKVELVSEGEWGLRFSATRRKYLPRSAAVSI